MGSCFNGGYRAHMKAVISHQSALFHTTVDSPAVALVAARRVSGQPALISQIEAGVAHGWEVAMFAASGGVLIAAVALFALCPPRDS